MNWRKWLGLCEHDWQEKAVLNVVKSHYWDTENKSLVGRRFIQECTKCKTIRSFEVMV